MVFVDITGNEYGRLKVISRAETIQKKTRWNCLCECGNTIIADGDKLKSQHTRSCGCLVIDALLSRATHGERGKRTKEFRAWAAMKSRCSNSKDKIYKFYGGRGIKVCDEWISSFPSFLACLGRCPDGHSLDRVDVNGNYEPGNVRWASDTIQMFNRRIFENNTSGFAGVSVNRYAKFVAYISCNKKRIHLGTFNTLGDAIAARKKAEIEYFGFHPSN